MIIELSKDDLQEIDRIAHLRNDTKKEAWNRRYCQKTSDFDMNVIGLKGEMAFSKIFAVQIDDTVRLSGDNGLDFTLDDQTFQVKSTKYRGGYLYFNSLRDFKTNYAVVTYPFEKDGRTFVEVGGFVSRKKFCEDHKIVNFGYGDRCALEKEDLSDIKNLVSKFKIQ